MARFPIREAEIRTLAQNIVTGITANPAIFNAPPVAPAVLQADLDSFIAASDQVVAARAAAEQATVTKDASLLKLTDAMKAVLRYAETTVGNDAAKLALLGWDGRAERTALQPPGQALTLEIPRQGEGWVCLTWNKPEDGGAVAFYKIERRERPAGAWTLVSVVFDSEATLNNQERGKDWEYRIIAVNKAGESMPSNIAGAVT